MSDRPGAEPAAGPSGASGPRPGRGALPGRLNLSPPPPGRLTSLRSRDLTLGGFKKKTFVPNLHSVRKVKDELRKEARAAPKKEKRDREERQRDAKRRRERPQVIQSHSIFEQGPADTIKKTGAWRHARPDDRGPSPLTKCIKKEKNVADEDEDHILQKLQRDDFLDDPGLRNDSRQRPTQLPLHQPGSFLSDVEGTPGCAGTRPAVGDLFRQLSVSDQEELFFVQLPDVLPGRPAGARRPEDRQPPHVKGQAQVRGGRGLYVRAKNGATDAAVPPQDPGRREGHVLSDFSEGPIGKLQIRKSGKVQLVLGNTNLDVSEGAAFSFLQQLVSVRLSEGRAGDMSMLGNVQHKLVCSPDFETLLQGVELPPGPKRQAPSVT
ncbi:DNA-directed RNA polymerase III subunit RPC4-like isoform X1 [Denticeps clupeoides]|uniref:DNA-directed RNA polymerase III subunit RPC4-like isoform X1 n=1 Tax=Denticeps clupeoides TaxID=299321 RepID=UPI0010A2ACD6|nr:DNA-directed RNA polymerase III subunit RPC4-like isoform X1 [Denticeps clupeoides]XP_028821363.1 DNA-directed RNA polymerase III subunit RPC4-like isoform X1 [Denticeps clupeoides]